jgi:hypothetical protein
VAGQQDPLDRGINSFLDELARYPDGGGRGSAMKDFTTAYLQIADRFLEVWAKSVVSVGGAAVGFTTTANNYAAADAATHRPATPVETPYRTDGVTSIVPLWGAGGVAIKRLPNRAALLGVLPRSWRGR